MSLFSAASAALSGMQSIQAQMQLTSNNIANASTPGYTTKGVTLAPVSLGSDGGGTQIIGYTRASDTALQATINTASSNAGLLDSQNKYLQQVQDILGSSSGSNPPLSAAVTQLGSAWQQLQASPENGVQQQAVVQAATNLVTQISTVSGQVEALNRQVKTDTNTTLTTLNSDLTQIAALNKEISTAVNGGLSPGNLQDQRDQLVQQVAGITSVTILPRPQGQIALYTPAGYQLTDGTSTQSFSYDGTNVTSAGNPAQSLNTVLTGGSLQAEVGFTATTSPVSTDPATSVIQKLRSQLDALANAFTASSAGPPQSFAYAYANAVGTSSEATSIFTGTDRTNFAVNPNLVNGSQTVKLASPPAVAATFNDQTKSFAADGLSVTGQSYATLATSIVSSFQEAASTIKGLNTTSAAQQTYLQQRMTNETGVNSDTQLVALTTFQNSYAASARVLTTINAMFASLFAVV